MDEQAIKYLIYAVNALAAIAFFSVLSHVMQGKFRRDIAPSKKYPHGRMIGEFWPESGFQYRKLVEIAPSGWTVKAPAGHKIPHYTYFKGAVRTCKYPASMPFAFLQVDAPIVSWKENFVQAIFPSEPETKQVTPEMFGQLQDAVALDIAHAVDEEFKKTQQALADALVNRIDKRYVYIGLVAAAGAAVAAAVFAFQAYDLIKAYVGV